MTASRIAEQRWKLVPVEPTPEMMECYKRAFISDKRFDGAEVYRAMLAASPPPAALGVEEVARIIDRRAFDPTVRWREGEPKEKRQRMARQRACEILALLPPSLARGRRSPERERGAGQAAGVGA